MFLKRFSARLCRLLLIAACIVLVVGIAPLVARYPLIGLMVFGAALWKRHFAFRAGGSIAHGSADWATLPMLHRAGMLGDDGLILGRAGFAAGPSCLQALRALFSPFISAEMACRLFFDAFLSFGRGSQRMIRLKKFVHLGTFAPAGKGKGVSCLIPNLLSYRRSCVVTDPKGELSLLTSEHRRRKFKHRVITLDPCNITGKSAEGLNPLAFIDSDAPDFLDQCRDLANMLVIRQGSEHDPHWNNAAELVLCAFISFVCACEQNPKARNLQTVRRLVSSRDAYLKAVSVMQQVDGFGGVIKRLGDQLTWFQEKELNSVLTHVQRHTEFLDSPAIQACTLESSFDPRELRSGKVTIYLVLPPERLVTLAALMRMWVGTIIRVITRGEASEKAEVLFLLDEAAHLGQIQVLEDAVTLMRGYGIRLWFFFQSPAQLKACYGDKAPVILGNLQTTQYFGLSSYEDAEEVSKRIGDTTVGITSVNVSDGTSTPTGQSPQGPTPGSRSHTVSYNHSHTRRRLISADELITMSEDTAIVFNGNHLPIAARLLRHYEAPEFRRGGIGQQRGSSLGAPVAAAALLAVSVGLSSLMGLIAEHVGRQAALHSGISSTYGGYDQPQPSPAYRPRDNRSASYSPPAYGGRGSAGRYRP